MQFYALDGNLPILASHAEKQRDYLCPECANSVRVRSGPERQPHFYHPKASSQCHLHQKSAAHLQTQLAILRLLPAGEGKMERHFPEISRIADVVWEKERIVFEIQYSPISLEEASSRSSDYKTVGFTPIWILHVRRFNRRKISASENFLRKTGAYYTNFNEKGHGEIFDQFEISKSRRRFFRGPALPLDLSQPKPLVLPEETDLPQALKDRSDWPLSFCGDLLDRFLREKNPSMLDLEKRFFKRSSRTSFLQKVKQLYLAFFRIALEKACR